MVIMLLHSLPGAWSVEGSERRFIIRKSAVAHCKRGPARCAKCAAAQERRYCLLELLPPGEAQRRVIEVVIDGKKQFCEYETTRIFSSLPEAQAYAAQHGITDVKWEDEDLVSVKHQDDPCLSAIAAALPAGWKLWIDEDRLMVERSDPVWVLAGNRINAPAEKPEEREARIRKYGKKALCGFIFRLEPRWSAEKLKSITAQNDKIKEALKALPEKYGIIKLYDAALSRKGEPVYAGKTEEEKKLVASFIKEQSTLSAAQQKLPDYETRWYSLFLESEEGQDDGFHQVFPGAAPVELGKVQELFIKHAERGARQGE
ncbi:MAG: hypothetical protein RDV48_17160 [Candidatus Eremiobacteraeota bacterium]|nr:hypothetical protein [Candidatus Eremiobacteraeota bacterium]